MEFRAGIELLSGLDFVMKFDELAGRSYRIWSWEKPLMGRRYGPGFALMLRLCLTVGTVEFRTGFGPLKLWIFGLEFLFSAQGTRIWEWGKYVAGFSASSSAWLAGGILGQ